MKNNQSLFWFLSALIVGSSIIGWTTYAADGTCVTLKNTLTVGVTDTAKSNSVTQLQDFLRAQGHLSSLSTGYFGRLTLKAVKDFQTSQNVEAIGIVGPLTRAAIQKISCVQAVTIAPTIVTVPVVATVEVAPVSKEIKIPVPVLEISLPYKTTSLSAWKGTWGNVKTTPTGSLTINATASTTGAEAIFPDSSNWTDYRYTANVIVSNGDITLISRYVDNNNFVSCTFSGNQISIRQRVNGETQTLVSGAVEGMLSSSYFRTSTSVSMRVVGKTIGCTALGGEDNLTYTMGGTPSPKGGIGIQTWGLGAATLELQSIHVENL